VAALAGELDAKLGLSVSLGLLQKEMRVAACQELSRDDFARAFSDLLWYVERECCQVLMAQPRLRKEDPAEVYSFQQTLGSGVYGPVRFATHKETGIKHAVKVLRRDGLTPGSQEERDQLDHELKHLRRLDHPNIVKLYEHYENSEGIFLVLDYCSGGQLLSMIEECRTARTALPSGFVADVMRQVLSAIAHMHSRSVVHLDLSTANVLLMPGARGQIRKLGCEAQYSLAQVRQAPHAMVIDFGIAQVLRPGMAAYSTPVAVGATLAPEVWHGDITPKADVFECGALLFEMLSFARPFECPREYVPAVNYWSKKPKAPWKLLQAAPREAVELCRGLLDLDRHARPEAKECYGKSTFLQESDPTCASLAQAAKHAPRLLRRLVEVPTRSWLHKSVALSIARAWPANESQAAKRAFQALDVAGVGRLDKSQIASILEHLGVTIPVALQTADAMDLSREGNVTWTEFVAACLDLSDPKYDEHLRRIFEAADGDGDDLLSQDDLASMFATEHLCTDVARDVFVEMTGRDEPGARLDWPTFRRHFLPGPHCAQRAVGATCESLDVASAVRSGWLDFVQHANGLLDQVRGQLWPGHQAGESDEVSEEKLQQLASMGFEDRQWCIEALRRHRGDVRRTLLAELAEPGEMAPARGADTHGAGEQSSSAWWLMRMF